MGESWAGQPDFPGKESLALPATPADKVAKEMLTAHRVDDMLRALAHATERMHAARKAATPALRDYHCRHLDNHLSKALDHVHFLGDNLKRNYPAEGRELQAVRDTVALARALSPAAKVATLAHLTETVGHELAHAKRHAMLLTGTRPQAEWAFNADHCEHHLAGAHEHVAKIAQHLKDNYPGEARWLRALEVMGNGGTVKLAAGPTMAKADAGYRMSASRQQRCGTCSMFDNGRCSLVQGDIDPDHVCDHWEKGTVSLAVVAKSVMNSPAPGPRDQYGLHMVPSQITSPSPPLPPGASLPTPREIRAVIKLVPDGIDSSLSTGVRKFLEQAAGKMEKNDPIEALAMLRGAQSSLYSASRKDAQAGMPAVYAAHMVPSAEQSSALARMQAAYLEQSGAWRKVGTAVAHLIDRIRRHWFRGRINGYLPNMRI